MNFIAAPSVVVRSSAWAAALLGLASAAGCWEEIHYQPEPEAVQLAAPTAASSVESPPPPVLDAPPLESTPAVEELPLVEEEPAEPASTTVPETPPPTDLFGDSASDEPPVEQPATGEASPLEPPGVGEASEPEAPPVVAAPAATPAERELIWKATSKWGLAAAMYAKQLPVERFEPIRDEADAAASELAIDLPPLPIPKSTQTPEQAVVEAFAGEWTAAIVASIAERYGAEGGALATLALQSNRLLLIYSPKRDDAGAFAVDFTATAEASGLPRELWGKLAELLDRRAEFVEVRSEVFSFQRVVDEALRGVR